MTFAIMRYLILNPYVTLNTFCVLTILYTLKTYPKHTFLPPAPVSPSSFLQISSSHKGLFYVSQSLTRTIWVPASLNYPVEASEFKSGYRLIVYIPFSHNLFVNSLPVSGTVPVSCFPTSSWLMGRPYLCGPETVGASALSSWWPWSCDA